MARFALNSTEEQLSLLKHVVRYYKGTAKLGIIYTGHSGARIDYSNHTIGLNMYSNSVYGDNDEKKTSAGYVMMVAGGVVSYKAYRQRIVTMSSTEAEYIALTYATKEINWIQRLLRQVGYVGNDLKPLHLHSDNQPGINMVLNDDHHDRTKHIDSYFKYTRQQCKELGNVNLHHLPGAEMPANGLTKPIYRYPRLNLA